MRLRDVLSLPHHTEPVQNTRLVAVTTNAIQMTCDDIGGLTDFESLRPRTVNVTVDGWIKW
jgi:hypothetical protein